MRLLLSRDSLLILLVLTMTLVSVPHIMAAQISLTWDRNTDSDLAGYNVYYGTVERTGDDPKVCAMCGYTVKVPLEKVTSYTISGLTAGTRYWVSLTAFNTSNIESGFSNQVSGPATEPASTYTVETNPPGLQVVADGSSYVAPQAFSWLPGSSHTISVPSPQPGEPGVRYVFASWSDGGTQDHTITVPSSSTTWTANFITQYSLTTSAGTSERGVVTPSGSNWYNNGQNVSISATANVGYRFSSWSGYLSGSTNPASLIMDGPKSVTANFIPNSIQDQYTLAVGISPSGSGTITKNPDKTTYAYGDLVNLTAAPSPGYTFSRWSGAVSGSVNRAFLIMDGPKSVTANFIQNLTPNQYTLTVGISPSGSGTIKKNPDKSTYAYGEQVTLTAAPSPGYAFSRWSGDASGTAQSVTLTINGNKAVTANYINSSSLVITPSAKLTASGTQGGPFRPSSQVYTLQNKGMNPINWMASKTQTWVTLSLKSGSLTPGRTVLVRVSINNNANQLKPGSYNETITFSNAANESETLSIPINLTVKPQVKTYTVQTNPVGLQFIVDGTSYTAPQIFNWTVGSSHNLEVPSPQNSSAGVEYRFNLWSNGGLQNQTITARPLGGTYTAYFTPNKALNTSANSSGVVAGTASGTNLLNSAGMDPLKRAHFTSSETSALPMIGELESPSIGKRVFGIKTIYGWALDGEGISRVKLYIDGEYICEIPYGGLTEGLRQSYPNYPNAERGGFALVWNYSNLAPGDHFVQIEVQNMKGEVMRLGANVIVHKISGEIVNQVKPMEFMIPGVNLTVDGNTNTYDLRLEWSDESQAFEIIDLYSQ